jgi:hypothetical protein
MTAENWISLCVPIASVIAAVLAYMSAKRKEIDAADRRLKEKYYLDFISDLGIYYNNPEYSGIADTYNTLMLVGSPEVASAAKAFFDNLCNEKNQSKFDWLWIELIKYMRKDLYKKSKVNKNYPSVKLISIEKK